MVATGKRKTLKNCPENVKTFCRHSPSLQDVAGRRFDSTPSTAPVTFFNQLPPPFPLPPTPHFYVIANDLRLVEFYSYYRVMYYWVFVLLWLDMDIVLSGQLLFWAFIIPEIAVFSILAPRFQCFSRLSTSAKFVT